MMNEIKQELQNLLLKILVNLGSGKVWGCIIGMAASAYVGYRESGTIGAVIAAVGVIGIPLTYTAAKTYQNTHGVNSPEAIAAVAAASASATAAAASGGPEASAAAAVTIVSQVKDRIAAMQKLVATDDGMWAYLKGQLKGRVNALVQHMLEVNPELKTIDAVMAVVNQYLGSCLTAQQCADVNAYLGLPAVMHAATDIDILASFEQAAKAGHLAKYQVDMFRNMAQIWVARDIVNEAAGRVTNDSLPVDQRRLALQEFGISAANAAKCQFTGGRCIVWSGNGYAEFNPYNPLYVGSLAS